MDPPPHKPSSPPRRLQFGLKRMIVAVVLLAVMAAALGGLLRPGPTWRVTAGFAEELMVAARGRSAVEPSDVTLVWQLDRRPVETKIYLFLAIGAPMGLLVLFSAWGSLNRAWKENR